MTKASPIQIRPHGYKPRSALIALAVFGVLVECGALSLHADSVEGTLLAKDGRLLDDWETKGNWLVDDDDVVQLKPRSGEKGWKRFDAYLWSTRRYSDFEIQFEYRLPPAGNSGFYFHVGDKSNPVERGIEVQLFDSHSRPRDAALTDHDSGGVIPGIPPTKNAAKPADQWNECRIIVKGDKFRVFLNDKLVNEVSLKHPRLQGRPASGYIGFQDHGMPLALRNVRIMATSVAQGSSTSR